MVGKEMIKLLSRLTILNLKVLKKDYVNAFEFNQI